MKAFEIRVLSLPAAVRGVLTTENGTAILYINADCSPQEREAVRCELLQRMNCKKC